MDSITLVAPFKAAHTITCTYPHVRMRKHERADEGAQNGSPELAGFVSADDDAWGRRRWQEHVL